MSHKGEHDNPAAGAGGVCPAASPASGRAVYAAALIALTAAAGLLRVLRLDHPMRYDEAFTFLFFAGPGEPAAWFNYLTPNNHVLHTLLVHISTQLGGALPPAIRIPAFLAGVGLVPAAAWVASGLTARRSAGLLAAGFVGASSLLIEYSVNARGYSMVCLATLLMAGWTVRVLGGSHRKWPWFGWVLAAAAGMFTIPIMIYPICIFSIILLLGPRLGRNGSGQRRQIARRLGLALAAVGGLTVLAYLPVFAVSGLGAIVANRFIRPVPAGEVLAGLGPAAMETLRHWLRDTSWAWGGLIGLGLASSTVVAVRRRRPVWAVPVIAVVVVAAAAMAHRVVPFPRVWLFMLPLVLVAGACGLDELAAAVSPRRARWAPVVVLGLLAAAAVGDAAWRHRCRAFLISEDARTLLDARAISRDVASLGDGKTAIVSQAPAWPSLGYYLLLGDAGPFVSYLHDRCSRAMVVVGSRQRLEGVLGANAGFQDRFGAPQLWRTYPHAKVYLARRLLTPPASSL